MESTTSEVSTRVGSPAAWTRSPASNLVLLIESTAFGVMLSSCAPATVSGDFGDADRSWISWVSTVSGSCGGGTSWTSRGRGGCAGRACCGGCASFFGFLEERARGIAGARREGKVDLACFPGVAGVDLVSVIVHKSHAAIALRDRSVCEGVLVSGRSGVDTVKYLCTCVCH